MQKNQRYSSKNRTDQEKVALARNVVLNSRTSTRQEIEDYLRWAQVPQDVIDKALESKVDDLSLVQ